MSIHLGVHMYVLCSASPKVFFESMVSIFEVPTKLNIYFSQVFVNLSIHCTAIGTSELFEMESVKHLLRYVY